MEPRLLRIFQHQIEFQCQAIIIAAQDLQRAMTVGSGPWAWVAIQNLLTAGANISKALWGQGGCFADERETLRVSLKVDDKSPLRPVVMRNHFEHYDERIDKWWAESPHHNYVDMSIGEIQPGTVGFTFDIRDTFRQYNPATSEVVFWGERFNLREIISEAERIRRLAMAEARKPHDESSESTSGSGQ